jgi:hypothetical protein
MGRAWSQGGLQALSFAPKPSASKFVDPQDVDFVIKERSSQGQTHRSIPRPCSGRLAVPLQIKGSHSSGQEDFMFSLDAENAFFHVPIHPKHRKFFSSSLSTTSSSTCSQEVTLSAPDQTSRH